MAEFLYVVAVAFGYQLLVLPGEKVQFIIAGLATRYSPLTVVAAAGTAFAGWTALEIVFGETLQRVLPGVALEAITAGLFLLFAVLLVRSAPEDGGRVDEDVTAETDGGPLGTGTGTLDVSVLGHSVPTTTRLGAFPAIFALMAAGEFGDKTQLITIGLAAQYGAHPGIWIGEMLAIVPVSLANAYLFSRYVGTLDARRTHFVAAGVFLFFGLDTLLGMTLGVSVWESVVGVVADGLAGLL